MCVCIAATCFFYFSLTSGTFPIINAIYLNCVINTCFISCYLSEMGTEREGVKVIQGRKSAGNPIMDWSLPGL